MKNKILIVFLGMFSTCSCQQDYRDLKIFLPENFSGYGAIIFNGEKTCTTENQTIIVQTDSLGIGYASSGDCFPQSGIRDHYFFYLKKGNNYVYINSLLSGTCEEADTLNGKHDLYHKGGYFMSTQGFEVLVFYIGKCDDPPTYMHDPEDRRNRELIEEHILKLKSVHQYQQRK